MVIQAPELCAAISTTCCSKWSFTGSVLVWDRRTQSDGASDISHLDAERRIPQPKIALLEESSTAGKKEVAVPENRRCS
jgi:hypothetical protein